MHYIESLLGLDKLAPGMENRLILALFSFLIFSLLLYFWIISRKKIKENNKDGSGLVYMAFAFLLHFVIGIISIYLPKDSTLLILSGLISMSYFSALSFFSIGTHKVDAMVTHQSWRNGIKYFAFAWVIAISIAGKVSIIIYLDILIAILAFALLGFFISRYFEKRGLRFLAVVSIVYFTASILLQLAWPDGFVDGKFVHMNRILISPALLLAVIVLAYTFNWINELNFYELSNIWISKENGTDPQQAYSKLTTDANRETWTRKIANDDLEKVIEEIIILKRHKNESLETILNIASRNTRNNNNYMKELIKYEDYQLNRNKVGAALMGMV